MEICSICNNEVWCWEEIDGKIICCDCMKKKDQTKPKHKSIVKKSKPKKRIPWLEIVVHRPWIELIFRKR